METRGETLGFARQFSLILSQIVMTVHSTNHNGGSGQHPSDNPYNLNADLTQDPLIAGFEWNVRPDVGQVQLFIRYL